MDNALLPPPRQGAPAASAVPWLRTTACGWNFPHRRTRSHSRSLTGGRLQDIGENNESSVRSLTRTLCTRRRPVCRSSRDGECGRKTYAKRIVWASRGRHVCVHLTTKASTFAGALLYSVMGDVRPARADNAGDGVLPAPVTSGDAEVYECAAC